MTYDDYLNSTTRIPVTKIVITLDYCANAFGVSPCTASGTQCYNTYYTCKDTTHFSRTTKEYKFCNTGALQQTVQLLNAMPLFIDKSYLSTEIQDDKTITARVNYNFADTPDYDQGIDPYWKTRNGSLLNGKGNFWKKLFERNPFYNGRKIEEYQGFVGLDENLYKLKSSLNIENVSRSGNTVTIECTDTIADLSNIDYPFKVNCKTAKDLNICTRVSSQSAMLGLDESVIGDMALRTDFDSITMVLEEKIEGEGILSGSYTYQIFAYGLEDVVLGASAAQGITLSTGNAVEISWAPITGATYYRIFGRAEDALDHYYQTTSTLVLDKGDISFASEGQLPTEAYRLYKLTDSNYAYLPNWERVETLTLDVDDSSDLDVSGYIQIEDEILFYTSLDGNTLLGVKRLQYDTECETKHYSYTSVYLVKYYTAHNGFTILEDLLTDAVTDTEKLDLTTIQAYRDAWDEIDFSAIPIIKSTDAAKLIFDLCYVLDVWLWVNEEGKITIKDIADDTSSFSITDADNIIIDSESVDFNQSEIYTRIRMCWNRKDATKGLDDDDNFKNENWEVDAEAESENMYNKKILLEKTTAWINEDCGTSDEVQDYFSSLLNKKINRCRLPRKKLSFDVELKDEEIKIGDVGTLTSDAFNDIAGNDYTGMLCEVIKKEPKGNKINLTVRMRPTTAVTTVSASYVNYGEPVAPAVISEAEITVNPVYEYAEAAEPNYTNIGDDPTPAAYMQENDILGTIEWNITAKFLEAQIGVLRFYDSGGDLLNSSSDQCLNLFEENISEKKILKKYTADDVVYMQMTAGGTTPTQGAAEFYLKKLKKEPL